jgi:uncharacterized RDD family membrane protein YckC
MAEEFVQLRKPLYEEGKGPAQPKGPAPKAAPRVVPTFAGFWIRLLALSADVLLLVVLHNLLASAGLRETFYAIGPWAPLIGLLIFLFVFVYVPGFIMPGQTLGKRLVRLRIVTPDFQNPPLSAYLKRFLVIFAVFIVQWPQGGPAGLRSALLHYEVFLNLLMFAAFALMLTQFFLFALHPFKRGLHDLWADTYVVRLDSAQPNPSLALADLDELAHLRVRRAKRMAYLMFPALVVVLGAQVVLSRPPVALTRQHAVLERQMEAIAESPVLFSAVPVRLQTSAGTVSPEQAPRAYAIVLRFDPSLSIPWDQVQDSPAYREIAQRLLDFAEGHFDPEVFQMAKSSAARPVPQLPVGLSLASAYQEYMFIPALPPLLPPLAEGLRVASWHKQHLPVDLGGQQVPGIALIPFTASPELTAAVATPELTASPVSP